MRNKPPLLQNHIKSALYKNPNISWERLKITSLSSYILDLAGVPEAEFSEFFDRKKPYRAKRFLFDVLFGENRDFKNLPASLRPSEEELNRENISDDKCRRLAARSKRRLSASQRQVPSRRQRTVK